MSTVVSSVPVASMAGRFAALAVGLGGVSMVFLALNRITLRYPPGSGGILSIDVLAMLPIQAWLVGGLIALIGVSLALTSLVMRRTKTGPALFALGMCVTSGIFGAILAI